ncbi:hypothetical protein HGM15179_006623 [Zosterops borbonicus]|uniref:Uncharacterized protein n=1 Tax=Zosterops borbonicus TaxID=364589 RepID=A0A8K1GK56_9PASS|nr:hypothetical protein HGM15179_006623 [Zosterops borbonicus]
MSCVTLAEVYLLGGYLLGGLPISRRPSGLSGGVIAKSNMLEKALSSWWCDYLTTTALQSENFGGGSLAVKQKICGSTVVLQEGIKKCGPRSGEATPGVLVPVLDSPVQERLQQRAMNMKVVVHLSYEEMLREL